MYLCPEVEQVAGSIHAGRGVPEQDTLTPAAPDQLAVALHGRHRRRCMNVCMNVYEWVNVRQALWVATGLKSAL